MEQENSKSRISFEWHSLRRDIFRNLWLLVLAALIAHMGIYVVTRSVYKPRYTSSATLVVRAKVGSQDAYANLSTASEMAEIFANVFQQTSMKELAAENMGREHFNGSISASVQGETNLLQVSVTADTPEEAFDQLNSVLEIYPSISEAVFTDAVIDVLRTPQIPYGPSNFLSLKNRTMIMLLVVLLEGGGIVLLSLLRDTVKNEKDFQNKVESRLLSTVVHAKRPVTLKERLRGKKRAILISDAFTELKFCEDYHKIATRLEYARSREQAKVFAVTSVAENEGKSTAVVNIGLALAERGYRVALLDLDVRKPALYRIFGRSSQVSVELSDVLSGEVPLSQMKLYRFRKTSLLLAMNKRARTDTTRWIGGKITREYLQLLRDRMDFILIDTCPLSVSADAVTLAKLADRTLMVVRTDSVEAEDLNDAILTLNHSGVRLMGCVLNDVYRPFNLFGQMGENEQSYSYYGKYKNDHSYGKYGRIFSEEAYDGTEEDVTEEQVENG